MPTSDRMVLFFILVDKKEEEKGDDGCGANDLDAKLIFRKKALPSIFKVAAVKGGDCGVSFKGFAGDFTNPGNAV